LTGCMDDGYDFNEVDMTVGIGGDGLSLPVSSTDTIKLEDVLELDGSESVVVKDNGDYVFEQTGDDVAPVHPAIDPIVVSQAGAPETGEIVISAVPAVGGGYYEITAGGRAQSFTYTGSKPDEVLSLTSVGVDGAISFTVEFPRELSQAVPTVDRLTVTLPSYMRLDNAGQGTDEHTLVYTDVPTTASLTVDVPISSLDFTVSGQGNDRLAIEGDRIVMAGDIRVDVSATASTAAGVDGSRITSSMRMDDITVTSAYGKFNPDIDLNELGNVEITGVPDFLTDGNVVVDLYNPQILLTVTNDMAIGGVINGVITSHKEGNDPVSIPVNGINVKPSGTTNVCICRRAEAVDATLYDQVLPIANLSDLISTIPDNITFDAEATADSKTDGSFDFGKQYTIQPNYRIEAPITFDADARIVYKGTLDGWNDDISDFELAEDSYVSMSATVENRVPAYLDLQVSAVDIDGNVMSENDITVEVSTTVLASADGENSAETPLTVNIRQKSEGAFSRLDGLVFNVEARASEDGQNPVVGKTLNAKKHFIIARDINVKLVGKVIGDFN
jgi:hypothetical protein